MISKPIRGTRVIKDHPLARGLVGGWLFNEGTGELIGDLSGYGNDGTFILNLTNDGWEGSLIGSAIDFTGGNKRIYCPPSIYSSLTGDMTAVTYISTLSAANEVAFAVRAGAVYWLIMIAGGRCRWNYAGFPIVGGVVNDGKWHHIVGVRKNAVGNVYTDSVPATPSPQVPAVNTSSPLLIGDFGEVGGIPWKSKLGMIMVYNRALNQKEINAHYQDPYQMFQRDEDYGMLTGLPPTAGVFMRYYRNRRQP